MCWSNFEIKWGNFKSKGEHWKNAFKICIFYVIKQSDLNNSKA